MQIKKPESLFQLGIKKINKSDYDSPEKIKEILKIILFKNSAHGDVTSQKILGLYDILDSEMFLKVMDFLGGSKLEFPESSEFKDNINLAVCYYLKEIKKKEWDDIKAILNDPDLDTVKIGIRSHQLKKFMERIVIESNEEK